VKRPILTLLASFALLACPANAQEPNANGLGWRWQNPLPQGNVLRDVEVLDGQTAVAVGNGGTILRTTDGGLTWRPQSSGTVADLRGVSFTSPLAGTAVGTGGTFVRTLDGGQQWTAATIDSAVALRSVKFTDNLHGIAVGTHGRIFRTSDGGTNWNRIVVSDSVDFTSVHFRTPLRGIAVGMNGRIFRTADGGETWFPRPSPTTQDLQAVLFVTPDFGVAVGDAGVLLRTTDGGDFWSMTNLGVTIPLAGISFGDSLHGMAIGLPGMNLHTTDAGNTWFVRPSGTTDQLWKASFADSVNGYAVGGNGMILRTHDGGVYWERQSSGTTNSLFGVSFVDANRGVAVGDAGMILRTTNAGGTWIQEGAGTTQTLWSVSMASTLVGTAVGDAGTILRSNNGGITWLPQASGTGVQLLGVSHIDLNNATAVGGPGTILRTVNGGMTWVPQPSGVVTGLNAVQMVSAATVYAVGNGGVILKTINGGTTWSPQSSGTTENLYGLSFSDEANGSAVGTLGRVIRTTDGGNNWMTQSSGTTLQLNSVSFASTTRGIAVGNGGMIIHSSNGGVTWSRQQSGTTNSLVSVDMPDATHAAAVGFSGTILYTDTGGEAPAPTFSVFPASVDFGDVTVGSTATDSVLVTNSGTALLSITAVASTSSRFTVMPGSALILAGASRKFYVSFDPVSSGEKAAAILFTSNAASSPDSVSVRGNGVVEGLGTYLSIPPDSMILCDILTGRLLKPVKRHKGLYPNWVNLVSEVFIQGGFQPRSSQSDSAGALRVGIAWMGQVGVNKWKPRPDSASVRCWVRLGRWNFSRSIGTSWINLQKTLMDNTGTHTGPPRGFDATGIPGQPDRRPLVKQQSKLAPKKHSNRLYAELVALKLNIAASLLGKTPVGFGELLYQRPDNLCDNLSVEQIAAIADTMMTYWQGYPQADYDSLYCAIHEINLAFASPLDTLSFEADNELILNGQVDLSTVSFLKPGHRPAQRLQRTTAEVTDLGGFDEEEDGDAAGPVALKLYQNYPNPFNPTTTIGFRLAEPSRVTILVFDMLGREVTRLASAEENEEGYQETEFVATGMASGVYFYRIEAQGLGDEGLRSTVTGKMVLLK
jgi:photosystem II stability/assembly factor-like uncharacterized protein